MTEEVQSEGKGKERGKQSKQNGEGVHSGQVVSLTYSLMQMPAGIP